MPIFKLPLSGDVVQSINPFTAWMSPIGSQFGLININLGQSSEPKIEEEVLSDVGTYGRQLGRIGDALVVLLAHFRPAEPLTTEETEAISELKEMLDRHREDQDEASPAGDPAGLGFADDSHRRHSGAARAKRSVPCVVLTARQRRTGPAVPHPCGSPLSAPRPAPDPPAGTRPPPRSARARAATGSSPGCRSSLRR